MIPVALLLIAWMGVGVVCYALKRPGLLSLPWVAPAAMSAFALVGAVVVSAYLGIAFRGHGATEVAWTGIRAVTASAPLDVGGHSDSAVLGWPTGAFSPRLRIIPAGQQTIDLEISGASAFVRANGGYLNGEPLPLNQTVDLGNGSHPAENPPAMAFSVTVQRHWFFWRELLILPNGSAPIAIPLRRLSRDRVVSLGLLVEREANRLRSSDEAQPATENHKGAQLAAQLENWADGILLLIPAWGDQFLALDSGKAYTKNLELPAHLSVIWPRHSLPIEITRRSLNDALELLFAPPWRASTPLPPVNGDAADQTLTVTGRVLPGDRAFLLPLAGALADSRNDLHLDGDLFKGCAAQRDADLNPYFQLSTPQAPRWANVTCEQTVTAGLSDLEFATVRDLPHLGTINLGLGIAWLTLTLSLWQCLQRLRPADRWVLGAIVLSLWLILLFRGILAFRYALEPRALDSLAVQGVCGALLALAVAPGFILLAGPMWRDQSLDPSRKRTAALKMLGNALALAVAGIVEASLARSLWPNVPSSYYPIKSVAHVFTVTLLGFSSFALFFCFVAFEYILPADRSSLRFFQQLIRGLFSVYHRVAIDLGPKLWDTVEDKPVYGSGGRSGHDAADFWWKFAAICVGTFLLMGAVFVFLARDFLGTSKFIQEILAPLLFLWIPICFLLSARRVFPPGARTKVNWLKCGAIVFAILFLSVFCFPFSVHDVGGIMATLGVFIPTAILLFLGGRPFRLQWIPMGLLILVVVFFGLLYVNFAVTVGPLSIFGETAAARILAWKEGGKAQEYIPFATNEEGADAPLPVTRRHLSDAIEHSRENSMIAHEGRLFGLGYGNAPTRRSLVRQDTIQFDSTFSFFVLSEHGWVGGIAILLLYFTPLVLILISAREVFDVGHGLAMVVAGSFVFAGLSHAGMNWGVLPFTGRNLPLLSANSLSDLLLWVILFAIAVQAINWRVTGRDDVLDDTDSLIAGPKDNPASRRLWMKWLGILVLPIGLLLWEGTAGVFVLRDRSLDKGFDWSGLLATIDSLIAHGDIGLEQTTAGRRIITKSPIPPDTLLGQEILRFNALTEGEKLEGTQGKPDFRTMFSSQWKLDSQTGKSGIHTFDALMSRLVSGVAENTRRRPLLFEVSAPDQWADEDETVPAVGTSYTLSSNRAYNTHINFRTGVGPGDFPEVSLRGTSRGTYAVRGPNFEFFLPDKPASKAESRAVLLGDDGRAGILLVAPGDPSISRALVQLRFHALPKRSPIVKPLGEFEVRDDGLYFRSDRIILTVHKAGNSSTTRLATETFRRLDSGDVIETRDALPGNLRPRMAISHRSRGGLIGSAWIGGNWVAAYDPDPSLPWTRQLTEAASYEWRSNTPADFHKRYGILTLDRALQQSAQQFTATHGRSWHVHLIEKYGVRQALPPRVALSILKLPDGEVLAIGGWPRMSSGSHSLIEPGGEIVPNWRWLEEYAPKSIRQRYSGDRNFDRLLMGSSTKPLWATAALAVHPRLPELLAVTGPDGSENEVFGIQIDPGWYITHLSRSLRGQTWCDFTSYLAMSDNRFHVRLGFLALTDPGPQGGFLEGSSRPASSPERESIDGGRSAWKRYPDFPQEMAFGEANHEQMKAVSGRPLAQHLRGMYGIGVETGDLRPHRYSFWTGNEADDRPSNTAGRDAFEHGLFAPITPQTPQFKLDAISTPREYISLLLGGGSNLWANVDFAGAFATAVQGSAVTPHITQSKPSKSAREEFPSASAAIRPGLAAVVNDPHGTAHPYLAATHAAEFFKSLEKDNIKVYAKTGTLGESKSLPDTSRLVLALVRWDSSGKTIANGLVFSMVVERGKPGLRPSIWANLSYPRRQQFETT